MQDHLRPHSVLRILGPLRFLSGGGGSGMGGKCCRESAMPKDNENAQMPANAKSHPAADGIINSNAHPDYGSRAVPPIVTMDNGKGNDYNDGTNNREDNTDGTNNRKDNTGGTNNRKDNTGGANNRKDNTGGANNRKDDTGGANNRKDDTGGANNRKDDTGGANNRKDDNGGANNRKDDNGGANNRKDDNGGANNRKDDNGGANNRKDDNGGANNRKDDNGGANNRKDNNNGAKNRMDNNEMIEAFTLAGYGEEDEDGEMSSFESDSISYMMNSRGGNEATTSSSSHSSNRGTNDHDDKRLSRKARMLARRGAEKVNEVGSLLGRVGSTGFTKAVEAFDTIGSSMTNLSLGSGFSSGAVPRGKRIGILAFEVANTVVKGFNLKQSLSEKKIRVLKEEIVHTECVQRLVSKDITELLKLAAIDKRNGLETFMGEVVRFGNHCRDPQWHQLDRYFKNLDTPVAYSRQKKEDTEANLLNLMTLAQHTAELYHEVHAIDRFEADLRRKIHEYELLNGPPKGDDLTSARNELKCQNKRVRELKKKSLWSKILDEVVEKLVDIVYFLHQEIEDAFEDRGVDSCKEKKPEKDGSPQRLGAAGLALHYANIINQIDNLIMRPSLVTQSSRDSLYQSLPPSIKASLRNRVQISYHREEQLTAPQIKAEMEKILSWLVPVATNTIKAHHGFGWVGEWANTGSWSQQKTAGCSDFTLLQTLHHADQRATEEYILELIVYLHHLICTAQRNVSMVGRRSPVKSPVSLPPNEEHHEDICEREAETTQMPSCGGGGGGSNSPCSELSVVDGEMLQGITEKQPSPPPRRGISKSQELGVSISKPKLKPRRTTSFESRLCKSCSFSPITSGDGDDSTLPSMMPISPINFELDKIRCLDAIDRVDGI